MWIIEPPSSTTRRASAAYSSGVYGIAGHWSRLATVPLIELVMTTGWSKRLIGSPQSRERPHLTEVVALALERRAGAGDLPDGRGLRPPGGRPDGVQQAVRLRLVAATHRVDDAFALVRHFLEAGQE